MQKLLSAGLESELVYRWVQLGVDGGKHESLYNFCCWAEKGDWCGSGVVADICDYYSVLLNFLFNYFATTLLEI